MIDEIGDIYSKFKALRRSTQIAIVLLFLGTDVVVYAAVTELLTQTFTSKLTKGQIFEMELHQDSVTGEVVPGSSVTVSPVVENKGTKDALAYIYLLPSQPTVVPAHRHTSKR